MHLRRTIAVAALAAPLTLGAQPTAGSLVPTVYGVGSNMPWQARSTIVTAGDPFNPKYFAAPGGRLDGVGGLIIFQQGGTFLCSGSLFAVDHVMTAAHCVSDANGVAQFDSVKAVFFPPELDGLPEVHDVEYARIAPGYTGEVVDQNDLAVLKLKSMPSAGVTRYELYAGPTGGTRMEMSGFGASGTGNTGFTFADGVRRVGANQYDFSFADPVWGGFWNGFFGSAGVDVLLADFDSGKSLNNSSCIIEFAILGSGNFCQDGFDRREVGAGPGDSGGPNFINGQLAGVNSFILSFGSGFGDVDNFLNGSFGEFTGFTNVQLHHQWLGAVTPEPGSLALLGTGLFGLFGAAAARRRRHR